MQSLSAKELYKQVSLARARTPCCNEQDVDPLLKANGWTITSRPKPYFLPPGIKSRKGNKHRVDYFDTYGRVVAFLKREAGRRRPK